MRRGESIHAIRRAYPLTFNFGEPLADTLLSPSRLSFHCLGIIPKGDSEFGFMHMPLYVAWHLLMPTIGFMVWV